MHVDSKEHLVKLVFYKIYFYYFSYKKITIIYCSRKYLEIAFDYKLQNFKSIQTSFF